MPTFDPENPTFYGEAYPVQYGRDVTGTAIATKASGGDNGEAVTYLYEDDWTQTADAGDSMLFSVLPDFTYLESDTVAVITVVVETETGSSGTFRLSAGNDPAWDLTSPSLATEDLGTFAASGRQQIVTENVESWTVANFRSWDEEPLLFLEVLTGTVVIRQIRVRVWPPEGVGGAWLSDPDYDLEPDEPVRALKSSGLIKITADAETPQTLGSVGPQVYIPGPGTYGGYDDFGDTESPFLEMTSDMAAEPWPGYQSFNWSTSDYSIEGRLQYFWALKDVFSSPGHDWTGFYSTGMMLLIFEPVVEELRAVTGGPEARTFLDPDRVKWETSAGVRDGVTGGPLIAQFGGWIANPTIDAGDGINDAHIGLRTFTLAEEPDWDDTSVVVGGGSLVRMYLDSPGQDSAAGTVPDQAAGEVALPDSPIVGLEIAPLYIDAPPSSYEDFSFDHAVGIGDVANGSRVIDCWPTRVRHSLRNVEYFWPDPLPASPRFFVKDLEGEWRPVGFGKPSDELAVFRVPTAVGMYRDLTTAEYASHGPESRPAGGYPLKVKRMDDDGSTWWDHVAWMVPDE